MKVRGLMICVFLICCLFGHIIEAKSFSKFDDSEIEKRLKTINKPAVKIIKTIHGERYGCVDFFKQPAFDHPSMKNHTYHYNMRPTRKGTREAETNSTSFGHLWENGVGCPIGTVPIRRVTKEDLLSLDSLGDDHSHRPRASWNNTTNDASQHHFAVVRTSTVNREPRYGGARMDLCITAPKVTPPFQFSAARLHIQIGDNDFLFVGSTVNPSLYRDNLTRIYVYTSLGGRACYNSLCDVGIVMVRPDIPLGMVLSPVSVRKDRTTHYARFGIIRDPQNGNWWFEFGQKDAEAGFWPASRFQDGYGNYIEWGGEVYSGSLPSPEMGFGVFPKKTWDPIDMMIYDAYMKRIQVLDKDYNIDPRVDHLEKFVDDTRGYNVIDSPMWLSDYPNPGHIVFYGGPGGI